MKFRITATYETYCYLDVEADTLEQALDTAHNTDGGDWTNVDYGDWHIDQEPQHLNTSP